MAWKGLTVRLNTEAVRTKLNSRLDARFLSHGLAFGYPSRRNGYTVRTRVVFES